ncbi:hypothetical protein ACNKHM_16520 [Shigella sonnei]
MAVIAIDFSGNLHTALLTSQLEEAIAQLDCEDGIVFLTDLLGRHAVSRSFTLAMQKPGCEVITGTNCNCYWKWCGARRVKR